MSEENKKEVDFSNLKPLDIKKSKGKFKTFTNGGVIPDSKFQPYLGKPLTINTDKIISIYPAEDGIGTSVYSSENNWKVLEEHETVVKRINE